MFTVLFIDLSFLCILDDNNDDFVSTESIPSNKTNNTLLLGILPDGKCFGVRPNLDVPESIPNEKAREKWLLESSHKAAAVKHDLENGVQSIDTVNKDILELEPDITDQQYRDLVAERDAGS